MTPPSATQSPNATEAVAEPHTRERRSLGVLALLALAALVRLAAPFGIGLFLGALLAFTSEPVYGALRKKRIDAGPAALICALGATISVAAAAVGFTTLVITRSLVLASALRTELAPGGALRAFAEQAASKLAALHLNVADVSQKLENEAVSLGSRGAEIAAEVAGATFGALLTLFFMTLANYFVLRHWSDIVSRAERLMPFEARHTHGLLEQFRRVGREVFLGTVVTGLVQGLFAGIGYWITGVPEPAFFGAITALASLIPGIGTLLVWVPIGIFQIATGHAAKGLIELVYSALTVGIASDYLIRPRLVGGEKSVPSVLTFVALFGGVEVFGIIGLVLGPVIVTLSLAVLKTYERESLGRTAPSPAASVSGAPRET